MSEDKNKLVPVNNKFASTDKSNEEYETIDEEKEEKATKEVKGTSVTETRYETKKESNSILATIMGILALLLVIALMFMGYRYVNTGTATYDSTPAKEVMAEKDNAPLKADKLDPTRVYALKDASDANNHGELTIKKAQFRKDQTRLWIHVKNTGGQKINMMPSVNSMLVDNNGHSYKVDSFASDDITGLAPGTDEDIMIAFEPIREDAKSITYSLDSVFDMKKSAWSYSITVDLP